MAAALMNQQHVLGWNSTNRMLLLRDGAGPIVVARAHGGFDPQRFKLLHGYFGQTGPQVVTDRGSGASLLIEILITDCPPAAALRHLAGEG